MQVFPGNATRQHLILIAGLVLLCAGAGLIAVTARILGPGESAVITSCAIAGIVLALFGIWRPGHSFWLFASFLLIQSSVFAFIIRAASPATGIARIWPFFMVFVGVAIGSSGFVKTRRAKAAFLMPAGAFVMLGLSFLPFSLRLVGMSFSSFVKSAWPVLIIGAGVILVSLYVGNRIRFSKRGNAAGEGE